MTNVVPISDSPKSARVYGPNTQIGVIIQARMTSKRFPGKVLHLLDGKPVIQHVIERCKGIRAPVKVKKPIKLIVAVPDAPESEPLLQLVTDKLGVANACGPEDNVLERYFGAAKFFNLDIIMRITADCPLINPKICSEVLQLLMWRRLDYTSNCHEDRTFPKGFDCEVFTYDTLEYTWGMIKHQRETWEKNIKEYEDKIKANPLKDFPEGMMMPKGLKMNEPYIDPKAQEFLASALYAQEHVTPYMISNPDVRKGLVKKMGKPTPDINLCVDVPEDIERLEKAIAEEKLNSNLIRIRASNDNTK